MMKEETIVLAEDGEGGVVGFVEIVTFVSIKRFHILFLAAAQEDLSTIHAMKKMVKMRKSGSRCESFGFANE
jgi:hypothetical protein